MAKATKTQAAPPLKLSTAATVHGKDAFGARFVKKGFAFTAEQDLQFALGWPHLYELAEGHEDDADPAASALRICQEGDVRSVWGIATAHRLARGWSREGAADMHGKPLPPFVKTLARNEPVTPEEAHSLVSGRIRTNSVMNLDQLLLVCEAIVGPDATVQGALDGLDKTPSEVVWGHGTHMAHRPALVALGLMLLRLRPADRDAALARWRKLYDRWKSEAGGEEPPMLDGSLGVLEPQEFVSSEGPLLHLEDAKGVVAWRNEFKGKPTDDDFADSRFVFLGGEDVYKIERKCWAKYPGAHAVIVERFGRVKSPLTVELMLELANKSKARKAAAAWFSKHADYARPELERLSKGPLADWAKASIASL